MGNITPFRAGTLAAGTTPVVPQYRVIGNYWTFSVAYTDTTGAAVPLAGQTPSAEILPGYNGQAIPLTVVNVSGNMVTFGLETNPAHGGVQIVPQGQDAFNYPVRIHAFLIDAFGHETTYAIQYVVPVSPQVVDLSRLPPQTTIIGVAGPAGPQGVPGIRADQGQIDAAITAAIQSQIPLLKGDPGENAYQLALANGFQGTQQQWLASLQATAGITQSTASSLIATALMPYATVQQVAEAIASIPPSPTTQDIATAIATALGPYATMAQVTSAITTALGPYSTTVQIGTLISTALQSYVTAATLATTLQGYTTPSQVGAAISAFFTTQGLPATIAALDQLIDSRAGTIVAQAIANLPPSAAPDRTMSTDMSNPDRGLNPLI